MSGHGAPVALAFDEVEGHLRVPASRLCPADPGAGRPRHAGEAIRTEAGVRHVLDIPSILTGLPPAARAGQMHGGLER